MNDWILAAGVLAFAILPLYFYVGERLRRRPTSEQARLPQLQFTIWWWGLGVSSALAGIEDILWSAGALTLPLALTIEILSVMVAVVILWGLVGYLTYLYTGKHHLVAWSLFYLAFFVSILYYEFALGPIGVGLVNGAPGLIEAHTATSVGPIVDFVVFALVIPELAGIVLYATLIRRTRDRTLRFRIACVTLGLSLWFGIDFVSPGSVAPEAWNLVKTNVQAVAAVITLVAYQPPGWLRRALRLEPVPRPEGPPAEMSPAA
jgi:hypothetical protein